MAIAIKVETNRVEKMLTGLIRNIPNRASNAASQIAKRLASEIRITAKGRGHLHTGYLSSRRGTFAKRIDTNEWVVKMPFYWKHLEQGTPAHFIPRTNKTESWARRRGMSFFMMKHIIAAKGTKKHPFVSNTIIRVAREAREIAEKEINKTVRAKGKR